MAGRGHRLGIEAVLRDHLKQEKGSEPFFTKKGSDPIKSSAAVAFWEAVVDRAEEALASGAMHSFECELEFVQDAGVEFVMRVATRFPPGETAAGRDKSAPKLAGNPFENPEPALIVRDLTPTHRALLNKYSVLREHLLVVTRQFEDQRTPLTARDFEALAVVMADAEVLAFYNGGAEAGASQGHRHLQVVTLPLSPRHSIPMDTLLARDRDRLPFRHSFARLPAGEVARPERMLATYRELHRQAGLDERQPYNLLVTHEWMLVVPRSRDKHEGISINSLAFAGSFFVRDAKHAAIIADAHPMSVLQGVAVP
jgi:sulfate adenylyltransferase (ADP) / ATP adenylyltransferase